MNDFYVIDIFPFYLLYLTNLSNIRPMNIFFFLRFFSFKNLKFMAIKKKILKQFSVIWQGWIASCICFFQWCLASSLCLNFFHLLVRKPNLEKFSIYSNKFFHKFQLSESSFTCPGLRASGLRWRLSKLTICMA